MANKVKTGLSLIAAIAAVVVLPISFVAWAEDLAEQKAMAAEQRMQGREEVIHSTQKAMHDYDFYSMQEAMTEQDLIALEQEEQAGVQLTATQQRKQRKLEEDLKKFEDAKDAALDSLKATEDDHETESQDD